MKKEPWNLPTNENFGKRFLNNKTTNSSAIKENTAKIDIVAKKDIKPEEKCKINSCIKQKDISITSSTTSSERLTNSFFKNSLLAFSISNVAVFFTHEYLMELYFQPDYLLSTQFLSIRIITFLLALFILQNIKVSVWLSKLLHKYDIFYYTFNIFWFLSSFVSTGSLFVEITRLLYSVGLLNSSMINIYILLDLCLTFCFSYYSSAIMIDFLDK